VPGSLMSSILTELTEFTDKAISKHVRLLGCECKTCKSCNNCCCTYVPRSLVSSLLTTRTYWMSKSALMDPGLA